MGGFIPLYRKIQNHPFYKEKRVFSKYEAWIDMLMEVRYQKEPEDVLIGMKLVKCGYGQSIKSLRTWAERWGWTAKKVSRFFNLLKKMGQIRHENVTVTTRVTILNYDKYCNGGHGSATHVSQKRNTRDTQMKHECPTDNKENNINKEKKEIILPEKNFSDDIVQFCDSAFDYLKKEHGKSFPAKVNLKDWYDTIDKLIRLDGFTLIEVKQTLQWGAKDSFWSNKIVSFSGLRAKKNGDLTKFQKIYNSMKSKTCKNISLDRSAQNAQACRDFVNED